VRERTRHTDTKVIVPDRPRAMHCNCDVSTSRVEIEFPSKKFGIAHVFKIIFSFAVPAFIAYIFLGSEITGMRLPRTIDNLAFPAIVCLFAGVPFP
jgi:hypothetical protein